MKKQIVFLITLSAFVPAMFAAQRNSVLNTNKMGQDIEKIVKESFDQKNNTGQMGIRLPLFDPAQLKETIDQSLKASKNALVNSQAAMLTIHDAYTSITNQLENELAKTPLTAKQTDSVIELLVKLYQGESVAQIIKGQSLGFDEGPVGRILALIGGSANYVQNLHAHFEDLKLLPQGINAHHGGVMSPIINKGASTGIRPGISSSTTKTTNGTFIAANSKAQYFIAYAIGRLVIYKVELYSTNVR